MFRKGKPNVKFKADQSDLFTASWPVADTVLSVLCGRHIFIPNIYISEAHKYHENIKHHRYQAHINSSTHKMPAVIIRVAESRTEHFHSCVKF